MCCEMQKSVEFHGEMQKSPFSSIFLQWTMPLDHRNPLFSKSYRNPPATADSTFRYISQRISLIFSGYHHENRENHGILMGFDGARWISIFTILYITLQSWVSRYNVKICKATGKGLTFWQMNGRKLTDHLAIVRIWSFIHSEISFSLYCASRW